MKVRAVGAAGGSDVADHVAFVHASACLHVQFRHVQVHRFEALAVVDSYGAAEDVERLDNFYNAGSDCANGRSVGRALVDSGVKFTRRLTVMKALYTEGRDDTTGNGSDEGIFPILDVRYGVAKGGQGLHFFRCRMKRFNLRCENDILRGEDGFANRQADGRERGSVLCEKFNWVGAWGVGYGHGHQTLPITTFLLEQTHGAAVEPRGGRRNFATKSYSLAQRNQCGFYSALLSAGRRREHCSYERQ